LEQFGFVLDPETRRTVEKLRKELNKQFEDASMGVLGDVLARTKNVDVPHVNGKLLQIVLGILNCFLFGVGVIIAGFLSNSVPDIIIGILQLVIPFVGWIWAVAWGVVMVLNAS